MPDVLLQEAPAPEAMEEEATAAPKRAPASADAMPEAEAEAVAEAAPVPSAGAHSV